MTLLFDDGLMEVKMLERISETEVAARCRGDIGRYRERIS